MRVTLRGFTVFIIMLLALSMGAAAADTPQPAGPEQQKKFLVPADCELLLTNGLTRNWIAKMKKRSENKSASEQRLGSVVQSTGFMRTALNQKILRNHNDKYTVTNPIGPVTDQKQSGRCWIFAGLNMLRSNMLADRKVPANFELSESYVHFFSMLEQSNRYLETVITATFPGGAGKDIGVNGLRAVMQPSIQDGGFYEYFLYLVGKYGVVPKSAMPETISSERTGVLLAELQNYLAEVGAEILHASQTAGKLKTKEAKIQHLLNVRALRERGMEGVWKIISTHLGDPPVDFEWRVDSDPVDVNGSKVRTANVKRFTPEEFARNYVGYNPDDYVVVSSFPNQKQNRVYEYGGTSVALTEQGENPRNIRFFNVSIDRLEELTSSAIEAGQPVWFAADVSRDVDNASGIMHPEIFDREGVYEMTPEQKAERLTRRQRTFLGVSRLNHAMVLTGLDRPDPNGPVVKYRNENSWGDKVGSTGVYHLYREWFRENVFEIVIHKSFLSDKERLIMTLPPSKGTGMY